MKKLSTRLLTRKNYDIRLRISRNSLKMLEKAHKRVSLRYSSNKNKAALLGSGYKSHIIQLRKEIEFYGNMLTALDKAEGIVKREWFTTYNRSLHDRTPLEVIMEESNGSKRVLNLLGRIEYGIID